MVPKSLGNTILDFFTPGFTFLRLISEQHSTPPPALSLAGVYGGWAAVLEIRSASIPYRGPLAWG